MIPLLYANVGEECVIQKVGGSPAVKKHLGDIGFAAGTPVTVVNAVGGNVIVRVLDARIAVSAEMAQKIYI